MGTTPDDALSFVQTVDLPPLKYDGTFGLVEVQPHFEGDKQQAFTVGQSAVAFAAVVPEQVRGTIANSLLLAQLAVQKNGIDPLVSQENWFNAYSSVLRNIGWRVTEVSGSKSVKSERGVTVHKAIIDLITTVLTAVGGGAAVALPLIKLTLNSLNKMDESDPWITLFKRESQSAETASCQVALADTDPSGEVVVSVMAFTFNAKKELTQVLFFKHTMEGATLSYLGSKATINVQALGEGVKEVLEKRLEAYIVHYISEIALPDPKP
jgi:hypothetical protein